jgi:hypothetical protein
MDFHKIWYLSIFRKSLYKSAISLKYDKNNGLLFEDQHTFIITPCFFLLIMKDVADKRCRENRNTHFTYNNFFFEFLAVYEKIWKKYFEMGRSQLKIWRMRITCRITKATNAHPEYVIFIPFSLQLSSTVTLYMHCLSCFHFKLKLVVSLRKNKSSEQNESKIARKLIFSKYLFVINFYLLLLYFSTCTFPQS